MPGLFNPLTLRGVTFPNRIFVSPMCQYSSDDGLASDWHLVHLGSRAVGGAALVMTEATAVLPEGRISPQDLGLWSDAHAEALAPAIRFLSHQGCVTGMQLAHAGRKGSTKRPWEGAGTLAPEAGGWIPAGPDDRPFAAGLSDPAAARFARSPERRGGVSGGGHSGPGTWASKSSRCTPRTATCSTSSCRR